MVIEVPGTGGRNHGRKCVVKHKHVLDTTEAVQSLAIAEETLAPLQTIFEGDEGCVFVYNKYFHTLQQNHDMRSGGDLKESVDLILCDFLFDVERQQDILKSEEKLFNAIDMGQS